MSISASGQDRRILNNVGARAGLDVFSSQPSDQSIHLGIAVELLYDEFQQRNQGSRIRCRHVCSLSQMRYRRITSLLEKDSERAADDLVDLFPHSARGLRNYFFFRGSGETESFRNQIG